MTEDTGDRILELIRDYRSKRIRTRNRAKEDWEWQNLTGKTSASTHFLHKINGILEEE